MDKINKFNQFLDTDLVSVLPQDIIFEIGNTIFRIYNVPRGMNNETLNNIGPYIYELTIHIRPNIKALNFDHFYNLISLNLSRNMTITDNVIRSLTNLSSLDLSINTQITDNVIKDLPNLTLC